MAYSVYGDVEHYGQKDSLEDQCSFKLKAVDVVSFLKWDEWLILCFIKYNSYEIVPITLSQFRVMTNLVFSGITYCYNFFFPLYRFPKMVVVAK